MILKEMSKGSGVTLLFEHSPSWASEIEHFEIFSCPRENKHNDCFLKTKQTLKTKPKCPWPVGMNMFVEK